MYVYKKIAVHALALFVLSAARCTAVDDNFQFLFTYLLNFYSDPF